MEGRSTLFRRYDKSIVELAIGEQFGVRGDLRAMKLKLQAVLFEENDRREDKSTRRGLLIDSPAGSAMSASPKAQ